MMKKCENQTKKKKINALISKNILNSIICNNFVDNKKDILISDLMLTACTLLVDIMKW